MRSLDDFLKGFLRADEHEASSSSKWVEWEHISQGKRIVKTVSFWTDAGFQRQKSQRLRCTRTVTVSQSLCPTLGSWIRRTRGVRTANLIPIYLTHRGSTHQKEKLFKAWGYTVEDAAWLQEELEKQAVYKYSTGQYTLGRLNKDGQRINIRIDLDRKDGSGSVSFVSGWMDGST